MHTDTKFIGVAGMEEADFLIYLSELLVESGKKVAVLDYSPEGNIFALLPYKKEEQEDQEKRQKGKEFTYHGVEYHRNEWEGEYTCQEFDIVFLTVGTGEKQWDYPAEIWYIFLTANRMGMEKTIQDFSAEEQPVILFIRDYCDYKITASYIRSIWKKEKGNVAGWYEIPFDTLDYEYRIRMQYEPVNEYKQLSKEMKETLLTVASKLTGFTKKEEEAIYKRLKRGKRKCGSYFGENSHGNRGL